ncbi:MAG: DUF3261 domain-containing protein [Treponema sp.]|nr:DUF3261 domain-containing protein [Treponema sp.]
MKIRLCAVLILLSLFVSCSSSRIEPAFSPVYVTNSSKYTVLPPVFMAGKLDAFQQMSAKFGDKEFEMPVYVVADETQLSMTVLNEFGTTLAGLFYDGSVLEFNSAVFPKNMKAEYIVADFQFCLYDSEELKSALSKIGIDFTTEKIPGTDGKTTEIRTLKKGKKIISKITVISETAGNSISLIQYENFLRGYSYTLKTLD